MSTRESRRSGAPRLRDVALAAGVSHQTVSRVLNGSPRVREDTRAAVMKAVDTLGYRRNAAARSLVTHRSGRLGVVVAQLAERGPATLATGLLVAARARDFEAVFVGLEDLTPQTLAEAVNRLLDQSVEAIVLSVTHRASLAVIDELRVPVPLVVVEGVDDGRAMSAGVDQRAGGMLATGHLLDLGHPSVAHVAGPLDWVEAGARAEGWRAAHQHRGRAPGPEWEGDWTAASGYRIGREVATCDDITAVFVANDQMALGLLNAVHKQGRRVPEDLSVVGFDNLPEAAFFQPPLTTIHQDFSELARRAVQLAMRAIHDQEPLVAELIVPVLVERGSTTAPRLSTGRTRPRGAAPTRQRDL